MFPESRSTYLEPVTDWVTAESRTGLWLIGGVAVLLLLVITCVTVGNALLVQVSTRRADLAVRAALGAGRGRLVRQLLAEGAVVATAGAAAGTLLAGLLLPGMRVLLPPAIPRGDEVDINPWWLAFAVAATGVSTLLAALAPAWHGSKVDLSTPVKRVDARTSGDRGVIRRRRLLVGVQAAVAAALLTGAALLLISVWRLTHMPLGFDAAGVVTLEMRVIDQRYRSPEALRAFQDSLPAVPAMNVASMDAILADSVADRWFYAAVTATFAGLALLLTAVGLLVVVSRAVVESRRELALRMALGAEPRRLHALVARQHLWPVAAGTVLGLLIAAAAVRVITSLLFQVEARSEVIYGGVALLVLIVGAAAAFAPTVASTRIPPAEALRAE